MKRFSILVAALVLGITLMASNSAEAHHPIVIPNQIRQVAPNTATINYSAMYQYQLAQQQMYMQSMYQQQLLLQQQQLWLCQQQQQLRLMYPYSGGY